MSVEFPEAWRYNPLRWDSRRKTWINAIPYRANKQLKELGEFKGVDVAGRAYFGDDNWVDGIPCVKRGIEATSKLDGYAVGIFVRYCYPSLVVVDCDSAQEFVTAPGRGNSGKFVTRRGRDQLLALFARQGEEVPLAPAVRGNREGHGYLIFRQNRRVPILSRKIKPFGMHFDVLGNGHQIHWSAPGNRALMQGRELLSDPPELPLWLAELVRGHRDEKAPMVVPGGAGKLDVHDGGWGTTFLNAVLAPVTPTGGAWNQRLFNAACTLAEHGVAYDELTELILERCVPEDDHETRMALDSIGSAWRKTTGETVNGE